MNPHDAGIITRLPGQAGSLTGVMVWTPLTSAGNVAADTLEYASPFPSASFVSTKRDAAAVMAVISLLMIR